MLHISVSEMFSSLLVCMCLLWCCSCYTTTHITPSREFGGKEITVSTKDGRTVHLTSWQILTNGDIRGKGKERAGAAKKVRKFEGNIPAEHVASVSYEKLTMENSILWGACLAGIVALGLLIHPRIPACGF